MAQQDRPVTLDDMYKAYEDCRRKKKNKAGTIKFEQYALFNCMKLVEEIKARKYRLKPSECFIVEYPTPREVFCASFRDRVVQHFVYNELNPVIEKLLIADTCSCRIGKGTDYAIKREIRKLRQVTDNYTKDAWIQKIDLSGFFMSINRQWLCEKIMDVVDNHYTGDYKSTLRYLVPIIIISDPTKGAIRLSPPWKWDKLPPRKTLFGNTKGLAIGNITSQLFANYALNDVDHYVKSRHLGYVRYVDDMVIIETDKDRLRETKEGISMMLEGQGMALNTRKSILQKAEYGVPFLGVIVRPYYAVLGKQRINRIYKGGREFADPYKAYESIATRKGMFQRYHGRYVARRWFDSLPQDIRKDIRMNSDTSVIWLGDKLKNNKLLSLEVSNDLQIHTA